MKIPLIILAFLVPLTLSFSGKEEEKTWEFLYLSKETQRDTDTKMHWTKIWIERNSPDLESSTNGVFLWPTSAMRPSEITAKLEYTSIDSILGGVDSILIGALGSEAPAVTYAAEVRIENKKETLSIGGRSVIFPTLERMLVNLILEQGWEPLSFDKYSFPDHRGATGIKEEIYAFRRPFNQ